MREESYMYADEQGVDVVQPTTLGQEALAKLDAVLIRLEEEAGRLVNRLEPVLAPEPPEDSPESAKNIEALPRSYSEVVERIRAVARRADLVATKLHETTQRVEF